MDTNIYIQVSPFRTGKNERAVVVDDKQTTQIFGHEDLDLVYGAPVYVSNDQYYIGRPVFVNSIDGTFWIVKLDDLVI